MTILEDKAMAIVDNLVANGAVMPKEYDMDWYATPMSYEGALVAVLDVLKNGGKFQLVENVEGKVRARAK